MSKAWEKYEADKRIEGFSPQTLKAYKLQSVLLIRYFKDVQLDMFTSENSHLTLKTRKSYHSKIGK